MSKNVYLLNEEQLKQLLYAAHKYWAMSAVGVGTTRQDWLSVFKEYAHEYGENVSNIDDVVETDLAKYPHTIYS